MQSIELLSPARNADIGIAAIDCGADAVYIGAPKFGARAQAGNGIEDIARLCDYASRFGARIFVTFNTTLREGELEEAGELMLAAQDAGASAFIIRDTSLMGIKGIRVPFHASTQCSILTKEDALYYEKAGCSRIILERQLDLTRIREICSSVSCEVECFVHGAICTGYSGRCSLSEYLDGRSADRGECIQACRSLYDLIDSSGKVLVKNKALLSLKDNRLLGHLEELIDAGVSSFKIEGRLKNISYVRNITREYSLALDSICKAKGLERASKGVVEGGFKPDSEKTFNRGYTDLMLGCRKDGWSSMDIPQGEAIGTVSGVGKYSRAQVRLRLKLDSPSTVLHNGDGFCYRSKGENIGFRGDICSGTTIICKSDSAPAAGMRISRNSDAAFEKELVSSLPKRWIPVSLKVRITPSFKMEVSAVSQDGREVARDFETGTEIARNPEMAMSMIREQLSKRTLHYSFALDTIASDVPDGAFPIMGAAAINSIRREIARLLDGMPCHTTPLLCLKPSMKGSATRRSIPEKELMRSGYCIRYELGLCPKHFAVSDTGPLYLRNNGRTLSLHFNCEKCEMTVNSI